MKHPYLFAFAVIVFALVLLRMVRHVYRAYRVLRVIAPAAHPEPDDYLDDVFGKGNRP
jgi:hypothetical protein